MIKILFIVFLFNCITFVAIGQVNTDSLFNTAISHSQSQNYSEAIKDAEKVLETDPKRYDVMVFIANVYAWQGKYNQALNYIDQAYKKNQTNKELYDSWLNILLWKGDYGNLLETIAIAKENNYPDSYNISLKKMLAYKGLRRYHAGINYAESNSELLDSAATRAIFNEMMMLDRQNILSAFYSIDIFENNNPDPFHLAFVDYGFKLDRHTLIARLNYANRFNTYDFQAEADYYHVFSNGHYLYSNYAISIKNELFPSHRAGLEYYLPFGDGMEASLGGRYFNAGKNDVYIGTGHIGKYFSNLWVAFRPFYVFGGNGNSLTTLLNVRLFDENPLNYWGLELAYGNSPDERFAMDQSLEIFRLNTYRFKVEKNIMIGKINELKLSAGYAYEEFIADEFRNRYLFEVIFKRRL